MFADRSDTCTGWSLVFYSALAGPTFPTPTRCPYYLGGFSPLRHRSYFPIPLSKALSIDLHIKMSPLYVASALSENRNQRQLLLQNIWYPADEDQKVTGQAYWGNAIPGSQSHADCLYGISHTRSLHSCACLRIASVEKDFQKRCEWDYISSWDHHSCIDCFVHLTQLLLLKKACQLLLSSECLCLLMRWKKTQKNDQWK